MKEQDNDLMLIEYEEEPWGTAGIGVVVADIPFSRNKLDKLFNNNKDLYEYDTYHLGQKLTEIALSKGYDFLEDVDCGAHSIFFCDYLELIDKPINSIKDVVKEVSKAILEVLKEVSNASEKELSDLIDSVGIGNSSF